jgi:hypothetical protein
MKRQGPLHVRPDEEPDYQLSTHPLWETWHQFRGCGFCGHADHQQNACPVKP